MDENMIKESDFLLVGGGVASSYAAHVLRREGGTGKIVILSMQDVLPYYTLQLPKAFLLRKRKIEQLLIFDASYYQNNDIEVILNTKALAIDTKSKIVKTDHAGNIYYNKLLIATGCSPKKINIPGADLVGVHYLRTISDAEAIIKDMKKAKNAVIYGNSFITIELASTLSKKDINVTIVTPEFNVSNFKVSSEIANFLKRNGIQVILGETVMKIDGNSRVQSIETNTGKNFSCDFIVIDMGLKPNTDFLQGSGIDVDNGIVVNQFMQTNISDIYAAGDVVKFFDPIFEKFRKTPYGDTAIKQGKIAAVNMLGAKHQNRTASYLFFNAFDTSIVILGDAAETKERVVIRGFAEKMNFAHLSLKNDILHGAIFIGRPITEIKAAESLIVNHVNLKPFKDKLVDISFPLEPLAIETLLTLQGGGALGAFECGVVKAMEETGIYPDIVAGISIGAFNSAIIAANPKHASEALEAFWNELSLDTPEALDEQMRRLLSFFQVMVWGAPNFFHPRWAMPIIDLKQLPLNWISFHDPKPIKKLLCKYVDFKKLKKSPIRLIVMAVNVETSEFEAFDSYTDDITPDHILASGSLPPGFPWTTINGKHYWDGGIVTNTPLDTALEICGFTSKRIYIVDLYPKIRCLPQNMFEVLARKDEILFNEKMRKDFRTRDLIGNYKKLIEVILTYSKPNVVKEITELPIFIQTMGDPGILSVTRIVREIEKDGLYSWDSDFSRKTIEEHKAKGYEAAKKVFQKMNMAGDKKKTAS